VCEGFFSFRPMPGLEQLLTGKTSDYSSYNALSADLHAFNEYLVPEITGGKDGRFVLIISCDGFRQGTPAVEELTSDVTSIQHWTITGQHGALWLLVDRRNSASIYGQGMPLKPALVINLVN